MTLRQNVRNYLVGLTLPEIRTTLELAVLRGEAERAEYIEEYLYEVYDDCEGCIGHANCHRCPGRDAALVCVECNSSMGQWHNEGCVLRDPDDWAVKLNDCLDLTNNND